VIHEPTPLGRIVIPDSLPHGVGLFYTTLDFDGHIDPQIAKTIASITKDRFGIAAVLSTCTQVHGATVQRVRREKDWLECDSCDALWTTERGVALGIKVADCLPVTIADPARAVLVNIHSGWRGAVQRITAVAIDEASLDPADAYAWLGPTIRACCFEVGEEVVEQFTASYADAARFIDRSGSRPHIDVAALTSELLRRRGFRPDRIFDSGLCTRCDGSIFHSYRRQGKGGGRNLAIACQ
jgi:YfiH family protein